MNFVNVFKIITQYYFSNVRIMYIAVVVTMLYVYGTYFEPTSEINVPTMVSNIRGGKCHVAT
jgi:hypothetical protein